VAEHLPIFRVWRCLWEDLETPGAIISMSKCFAKLQSNFLRKQLNGVTMTSSARND